MHAFYLNLVCSRMIYLANKTAFLRPGANSRDFKSNICNTGLNVETLTMRVKLSARGNTHAQHYVTNAKLRITAIRPRPNLLRTSIN